MALLGSSLTRALFANFRRQVHIGMDRGIPFWDLPSEVWCVFGATLGWTRRMGITRVWQGNSQIDEIRSALLPVRRLIRDDVFVVYFQIKYSE